MSAEHRLTTAGLGLFGKHPGFGDFITAGDLPDAAGLVMDWLAATLGGWRDAAGPDWQALFDRAPALRFWIGPALVSHAPAQGAAGAALRGILAPSRDRSGRRFPLGIVQSPAGPTPLDAPDQAFHDRAEALLANLTAAEIFEPREAAAEIAAALPAPANADDGQHYGGSFWALNPSLPPAALLAELGEADRLHAQATRSYWWFASDGQGMPGGVLALTGWPDAAGLGWLLARGNPPAAKAAPAAPDWDSPLVETAEGGA